MNLPATIEGIVVKNKQRGSNLGYPTANIPVTNDQEDGLYVGYTTFDKRKLPSLIFIGVPVTFEEDRNKRAEAHILDFTGDLYGKRIEVELVKKLRGNMKFDSADELILQMRKDEEEARKYFKRV